MSPNEALNVERRDYVNFLEYFNYIHQVFPEEINLTLCLCVPVFGLVGYGHVQGQASTQCQGVLIQTYHFVSSYHFPDILTGLEKIYRVLLLVLT